MIKKIIGYILISLPFIGIGFFLYITDGIIALLSVFVPVLFALITVGTGLYLLGGNSND